MINTQAINIQNHLLHFTMAIKKKRDFNQVIILDLFSSIRRILRRLGLARKIGKEEAPGFILDAPIFVGKMSY